MLILAIVLSVIGGIAIGAAIMFGLILLGLKEMGREIKRNGL